MTVEFAMRSSKGLQRWAMRRSISSNARAYKTEGLVSPRNVSQRKDSKRLLVIRNVLLVNGKIFLCRSHGMADLAQSIKSF